MNEFDDADRNESRAVMILLKIHGPRSGMKQCRPLRDFRSSNAWQLQNRENTRLWPGRLNPLGLDRVRTCHFPIAVKTRNNRFVYLPRAFAQQPLFQAAVDRATRQLAPDVVDIMPTLGNDWSGAPAVFFMVILADAASRREQLLRVTNQISSFIVQQVQPLEQWGVLPYFNFRSQSEQARIDQHALAS